jgi:hypothetical protein
MYNFDTGNEQLYGSNLLTGTQSTFENTTAGWTFQWDTQGTGYAVSGMAYEGAKSLQLTRSISGSEVNMRR